MESKPYALVVKGLSRLPVTEEIAGSNPVERAKKNESPFDGSFFLVFIWIWAGDRGSFSWRKIAGSRSTKRKLELARVSFGAEEPACWR